MPRMKRVFLVLWTLGIISFSQPSQSNENHHLRRYRSNEYLSFAKLSPSTSDSAFGQDDSTLGDVSVAFPRLIRVKRDPQEENQGGPRGSQGPGDPRGPRGPRKKDDEDTAKKPGETPEETTETDDKAEKGLLEFKWITYLLIFAIINLVTLLLIGIAFVVYFVTRETSKGKNDCNGDNGCGESDDECSCDACCKSDDGGCD